MSGPASGRAGRSPTERGERRREALVRAAAAILEEEGFAAVGHRAVAARAGVPLAATTYYFASGEELLRAAVEHLGEGYRRHAAAVLERLPAPPQPPEVVAGLIVALVVGPDADRGRLLTFYERYVQAGRRPALRPVVAGWTAVLVEQVAEVLARYGHEAAAPAPALVTAVVDGRLLALLVEGDPHPVERVRGEVAVLLGALASARSARAEGRGAG